MKVGDLVCSTRKDSEWLIWHEVMKIDGDNATLSNYGKDMKPETVVFRKRDLLYCLRKGMLKRA